MHGIGRLRVSLRLLCATLVLAVSGCRPSSKSAPSQPPPDALASSASPVTSTLPSASAAPSGSASSADVVANASTNESHEGSVAIGASVDGSALRAKNRARLAADHSPVTLLQATPGPHAAEELGRRLCEAVVPQRPPETHVLLKPNLGGFEWFRDPAKNDGDNGIKGRTTDPEFVRGVIHCLRARGHQHITIAEGWGATHKDWERLVRVSGYQAMADEEKTPLVAMDDDGVFDVAGDQPGKALGVHGMEKTHVPTLLMPKILAEHLEHGLFLSLPKIKAHRFGVVSMAVKGMQGTVMLSDAVPAFHQKWRMHKELGAVLEGEKHGKDAKEDRAAYVRALEIFAERIADVLEVEAPDAVLAEGAPAMGGDGFGRMWASKESVAIGGTNPVLVDRVGAAFLGLWKNEKLAAQLGGHATSPLLETAAKRFGIDLEAPTVVGDGATLLDRPRPVHFVGMAPFAIHSDNTPATKPGSLGSFAPTSDAGPHDKPTAHAAPLGSDTVTLDGRGDDAAWQRAPEVTWDTDYAGAATGIVTHARFLYSPTTLYALFRIEHTGLHTDRSRPTDVPRPKLYEEDCVESFFTPDRAAPHHYYEIELGPFGHHLDIDVNRDTKQSSTDWSSHPRIATTQDATTHVATIEVAFDAPEIAHALVAGHTLPFALYRMEGTGARTYLAWSPPRTAKPNFHVPDAFGSLVLDP